MSRLSPRIRNASTSRRRRGRVPVIGVIGPIGAGKSAVANLFQSFTPGSVIISGDEIGHDVVTRSRPLRNRLARAFGDDILAGEDINRSLLARRAFATRATHEQLNALVHPALLRELRRQVRVQRAAAETAAVIIDAALLVEWGRDAVGWDHLIGVYAPQTARLARLGSRGWTTTDLRRRTRCQLSWREKRRHCDCIVTNDASRTLLRRRAQLCWQNALSSS